MSSCQHNNLLLLAVPASRLRCRHCHLTIQEDELNGDWCPECYEVRGRRRNDFEVLADEDGGVRYRCEDCGILVVAN